MIEARGLVKRYGSSTAVDNLSFDVRPGTVTGFLGPNGAGKSTTMRMILGLDPEGIRWIRGLLTNLASHGRTVLISSHLISEVAQTADQLIVIGQGRLLAQTTVAELSARSTSQEEAFFQLTDGSAEYSASYEASYGINYPLRSVS